MSKRFDQNRKEVNESVRKKVKSELAHHYDVPHDRIISVESHITGEYNTNGDYTPGILLDYLGMDWIVDKQPEMIGVGERIRPNRSGRRDFSWRVDNGTAQPCENDRIPASIENDGLYPRDYLYGWRDGFGVEKLWLLDTAEIVKYINTNTLETKPNGDGTMAAYIPISELALNNCIKEVLIE